MPFPVGIPAGVAVRLVVDTVALTVPDALFQTAAGAGLTLPGTGIDRRSVTGNSQVIQVDKPLVDGNIQKLGFENLKQARWLGRSLWEVLFQIWPGGHRR